MSYLIRQAEQNDILRLEELLADYMQELFHRAWGGTRQLLEQHGFADELGIAVAETFEPEIVAFVAWISSYDLHHCMKGGEVIDLYVAPPHRGHGLAMMLLADVAMRIRERGGTYLKGQALNNPAAQRLYRRCARCFQEMSATFPDAPFAGWPIYRAKIHVRLPADCRRWRGTLSPKRNNDGTATRQPRSPAADAGRQAEIESLTFSTSGMGARSLDRRRQNRSQRGQTQETLTQFISHLRRSTVSYASGCRDCCRRSQE